MNLILAHGLGGRSDLPVPLWLALYGGALAVIVSFVALLAFWARSRFDEPSGRPLPDSLQAVIDSPLTRVALRALGLGFLILTLLSALIGGESAGSNPAPTWLYVWFWVGLVPASLLLGPVWKVLNPLRAISLGLARLIGDPQQRFVKPIPDQLGYWPAAATLVVFVWLELVYDQADDPGTVFAFVAVYSLVQILFAQRYGNDWYARGDGFEVYSTILSRLAPIGRHGDGKLILRNPMRGLALIEHRPGLVGVVAVLLGSTAFDGLTRTELWEDLTAAREPVVNLLIGSLGLAASIAFVYFSYAAATSMTRRYTSQKAAAVDLPSAFAHSLIPIAVGYTIAHYFSLFIFQGQAGYILGSDPFDRGLDLLGTGDWIVNYTLVSTKAIALVQVGAIVLGHIVGVLAAHDRAVAIFKGRHQTTAQFPLLTVMVIFTVGGIALLVGT